MARGKCIADTIRGHTDSVSSIAFSPDGKRIVSGSFDCTVRVWDVETGMLVAGPFKGHTDWVSSVAFSPDGSRVISGSDDRTVRIWEVMENPTVHREHLTLSNINTKSKLSAQCRQSLFVRPNEISWKLGSDGWIKDEKDEILMWVPIGLRQMICRPGENPTQPYNDLGDLLRLRIYNE